MKLDFNEILKKDYIQEILLLLSKPSLNTKTPEKADILNTAVESLNMIKNIDMLIYIDTGLPMVDLDVVRDLPNDAVALYKYDGKSNKSTIYFNINHCINGLDYISSYVHEKIHHFETYSVFHGNNDIPDDTLNEWKACFQYEQACSEDIYNPVEIFAYQKQKEALMLLIDEYITNKKIEKYIKDTSAINSISNILQTRLANVSYIVDDQKNNTYKTQIYLNSAKLYSKIKK